jgi:hypothetical protein
LAVTPVLQLGWVGIDLIDSDVIILIFLCCIELSLLLLVGVGCPNSNNSKIK